MPVVAWRRKMVQYTETNPSSVSKFTQLASSTGMGVVAAGGRRRKQHLSLSSARLGGADMKTAAAETTIRVMACQRWGDPRHQLDVSRPGDPCGWLLECFRSECTDAATPVLFCSRLKVYLLSEVTQKGTIVCRYTQVLEQGFY